jgi:hypothetical protein
MKYQLKHESPVSQDVIKQFEEHLKNISSSSLFTEWLSMSCSRASPRWAGSPSFSKSPSRLYRGASD